MIALLLRKYPVKGVMRRLGLLMILSLLVFIGLSEKGYAAERCSTVPVPGNPRVDAVVYVPIIDANGNFLRYSRDFTIRVTAIDPAGVLNPLPRYNVPNIFARDSQGNPLPGYGETISYPENANFYLNLGIQNKSTPVVTYTPVGTNDRIWFHQEHVSTRDFRVNSSNGVECYPMGGAAGQPQNGYKLIFSDGYPNNPNPWTLDCAFFVDRGYGLGFRFELLSVNDLGGQAYNFTSRSYDAEGTTVRSANGIGYRIGDGLLGVQLSPYPAAIVQGWKTDMATKAANMQGQPFSNARIAMIGIPRESSSNPYGGAAQGWAVPTHDLNGARTWIRLQAPDPPPAGWRLVGYTRCDQDDVDAGRFNRTQVDDGTCNRAKDPRANPFNNDTAGFQPPSGYINIWWFYEPIPPVAQRYYPWLQTMGANIMSWGQVIGQPEGLSSSRPLTATGPSDATNVILAYLASNGSTSAKTGPFCSDNLYALGDRQTVNLVSGDRGSCPIGKYTFSIVNQSNGADHLYAYVRQNNSSSTLDLVKGQNGEEADGMAEGLKAMWNNNVALRNQTVSGCGLPNPPVTPISPRTRYFRLGILKAANSDITRADYQAAAQTQGLKNDNTVLELSNSPGTDGYGGIYCAAGAIIRTNSNNSNALSFGTTGAPQSCGVNSGNNLFFRDGGRTTFWADTYNGNSATRDVYIKGNICTEPKSGNYQDARSIAQIGIVATGNVYIDPEVTDVAASIYAVGKVYTCYRAGEGVDADNYYKQSGGNKNCDKQLHIKGSVAGRSGIVWGRKYFKNPADPGDAAEKVTLPGEALGFPPVGWGVWTEASDDRSTVRYIEDKLQPRF